MPAARSRLPYLYALGMAFLSLLSSCTPSAALRQLASALDTYADAQRQYEAWDGAHQILIATRARDRSAGSEDDKRAAAKEALRAYRERRRDAEAALLTGQKCLDAAAPLVLKNKDARGQAQRAEGCALTAKQVLLGFEAKESVQ